MECNFAMGVMILMILLFFLAGDVAYVHRVVCCFLLCFVVGFQSMCILYDDLGERSGPLGEDS